MDDSYCNSFIYVWEIYVYSPVCIMPQISAVMAFKAVLDTDVIILHASFLGSSATYMRTF